MADPAAARVPTESQSFPIPSAGEQMFVRARAIGAEAQDVGGTADVEELADARAEEHEGLASVDDAGEDGRALREAEAMGGSGSDGAGDLIGFENSREFGDGDAGGIAEFFAPGAELERFV